jgi:hypothetical protein
MIRSKSILEGIRCLQIPTPNSMEMVAADLPKKTVSNVKKHWNTSRRKQLMLKIGMNAVTHMPTFDPLN